MFSGERELTQEIAQQKRNEHHPIQIKKNENRSEE
tara:strand:- start:26834 stop:26938 length:105 start_codon:yes stop_codon:yes gene_type:complete